MAGTQFAVDLVFKTQGGSQLKDASRSVDKISAAANKAQGSVDKASNNIRKFGQSSTAASAGSNKLASSLKAMVVQLAAVTAATVGVQQSLAAAFERSNAEKRLQNLTSSAAEYEQALRLAKISSQEFGTTQTEATKALGDVYSRLRGVGFGLTEVSEIYKGFNVIAAQSGVASEDAAGAFLQLSQALGSGKLQGDELRSILERMPQLAQAIAAEMGIAAGEVRKAGADGKITGDVMYAALKKASNGSFDLSKTLTEQQATMNQVKQRAEELQVALGEALAPVFLTAMNKLGDYALVAANAFKKLNDWALKNADSIERFVKIGLEIGKIVASVAIVVKAYQLWQKAVAAVAAAKASLLAMTGPKGWALIAAGATAAGVAYFGLTKTINDVEGAVTELEAETKKELETTKQLAKENEDLYRLKGEGADKAKTDTKAIAEAQKEITAEIKNTVAALDAQQKKQETIGSMVFEIAQQRNKVEQAITGTLLDQAQAQLDGAKTQKERIKAAKAIYELTVRQAELETEAAKAAIAESVRKVESQLKFLQLKEREIATEVALARANGVANEQHEKALQLARGAVEEAATQLKLKQELAGLQNKEIDALLQGKINTAEMAYQQNIVANETERAANSAGSFASNMGQAATQAERAAAAVQRAASSGGSSGGGGYRVNHGQKVTQTNSWGADVSQETVNAVLSKHSTKGAVQGNNGDWHINWDANGVGHGEMTYNKLLNQMRDYQLNQIQAQAYNERNAQLMASHREWVAQGSGGQGGNVSVNYSGSTMNFDGNQYVNQKDVNGIVQQAVTAMNNNLRRSSSTRLNLGLT